MHPVEDGRRADRSGASRPLVQKPSQATFAADAEDPTGAAADEAEAARKEASRFAVMDQAKSGFVEADVGALVRVAAMCQVV